MRIYTGYFAKIKTYIKDGLFPVSIALSQAKWIENKIPEYRKLNPRYNMLSMDEYKYMEAFDEILYRLSQCEVIKDLERISNGENLVLICWEKPEEFCHRELVAEWLNHYLPVDEKVTEYGISPVVQQSLF